MAEHIFLVGFMASGKSTIGQLLAKASHRSFLDTDVEIERRTGLTVAQIFQTMGEPAFRQMETDLLNEIVTWKDQWVVATGGGMVINEGAMDLMKRNGKVIFLKRSFKKILLELRSQSSRPLAVNRQKKELCQKYKARLSTYMKADMVVYNRKPQDAVAKIMKYLA